MDTDVLKPGTGPLSRTSSHKENSSLCGNEPPDTTRADTELKKYEYWMQWAFRFHHRGEMPYRGLPESSKIFLRIAFFNIYGTLTSEQWLLKSSSACFRGLAGREDSWLFDARALKRKWKARRDNSMESLDRCNAFRTGEAFHLLPPSPFKLPLGCKRGIRPSGVTISTTKDSLEAHAKELLDGTVEKIPGGDIKKHLDERVGNFAEDPPASSFRDFSSSSSSSVIIITSRSPDLPFAKAPTTRSTSPPNPPNPRPASTSFLGTSPCGLSATPSYIPISLPKRSSPTHQPPNTQQPLYIPHEPGSTNIRTLSWRARGQQKYHPSQGRAFFEDLRRSYEQKAISMPPRFPRATPTPKMKYNTFGARLKPLAADEGRCKAMWTRMFELPDEVLMPPVPAYTQLISSLCACGWQSASPTPSVRPLHVGSLAPSLEPKMRKTRLRRQVVSSSAATEQRKKSSRESFAAAMEDILSETGVRSAKIEDEMEVGVEKLGLKSSEGLKKRLRKNGEELNELRETFMKMRIETGTNAGEKKGG